MYLLFYANPFSLLSYSAPSAPSAVHKKKPFHKENSIAIAILAGVVNFLPHPNPPLSKGREKEIHKWFRIAIYLFNFRLNLSHYKNCSPFYQSLNEHKKINPKRVIPFYMWDKKMGMTEPIKLWILPRVVFFLRICISHRQAQSKINFTYKFLWTLPW